MSIKKTIKEYLEVAKNGVLNGDKIVEAIMVSAQVKQAETEGPENVNITVEAIAEIMRRKDLCKVCEFNSANRTKNSNYKSSLPFTHCTLCKCRIQTDDSKEYCLSCNCGIVEWNRRNQELPPMKPKWEAFKDNKTENK